MGQGGKVVPIFFSPMKVFCVQFLRTPEDCFENSPAEWY